MAGPSEAKAHYKNHAPRRLAAARGRSRPPGIGFCLRLCLAWAGHVQVSVKLFCCYHKACFCCLQAKVSGSTAGASKFQPKTHVALHSEKSKCGHTVTLNPYKKLSPPKRFFYCLMLLGGGAVAYWGRAGPRRDPRDIPKLGGSDGVPPPRRDQTLHL